MAAESLEGKIGMSQYTYVTNTRSTPANTNVSIPVVRTPSEEHDGTDHCQSSQNYFGNSDVEMGLTNTDASIAGLLGVLAAKDATIAEQRKRLVTMDNTVERMRREHRATLAAKENTMEQMRKEHRATLAAKENTMEQMRKEHRATLDAKENTMEQMSKEHRATLAAKDAAIDHLTRERNDLQSQLYQSEQVITSFAISEAADSGHEIDQLEASLSVEETNEGHRVDQLVASFLAEETNEGFHENVYRKCVKKSLERGKETVLSEQLQLGEIYQPFGCPVELNGLMSQKFDGSSSRMSCFKVPVAESQNTITTLSSPMQEISQSDFGRTDVQEQRNIKLDGDVADSLKSLIKTLDISKPSCTLPLSENISFESLASSLNLPTTTCSQFGLPLLDFLTLPTTSVVEKFSLEISETKQLNPEAQSQLTTSLSSPSPLQVPEQSNTKESDSDFSKGYPECDQLHSHNRKRPRENEGTEDQGIKKPKLMNVKDKAYIIKTMERWEMLASKSKDVYFFALKLMDEFFDKETLAGSLVLESRKSDKPALDPEKIKMIFGLCKKHFGDFDKKTMIYKMDTKCRDSNKNLKKQRSTLSSNVDTENSVQKNSNAINNHSNSKKTRPTNCRSGHVAHYCYENEDKNVQEDEKSVMAIQTPLFKLSKRDMNLVKHCDACLNDKVITASQEILAQQFPHVKGLQPPTLQQVGAFKAHDGEFVQIINVKGIHWCVVSTIGCKPGEVKVYDTVYQEVQASAIPIITSLLSCPTRWIHMMDVGRQCNDFDCGVLSVAIAFDLCSGRDPTTVEYVHSHIREHLESCLTNCSLSQFPIRGPRMSTGIICSKEIP